MIAEAPFLFSIAGISASLAGLAGLVAGLRRGSEIRALDLFRLREIVEFAFANVLVALSTIPLTLLSGESAVGFRLAAGVALAYILVHVVVLLGRSRRQTLPRSRAWYVGAGLSDIGIILAVGATLISGSTAWFEVLLLVLLARPMYAFLLVLSSMETP